MHASGHEIGLIAHVSEDGGQVGATHLGLGMLNRVRKKSIIPGSVHICSIAS